MEPKREPVRRLSISLPESIYQQFESLVEQRGFRSRSQAIAEMISSSLADDGDFGDREVSATLTLCFDHTIEKLSREKTDLQCKFREEIVSSFHALVDECRTVEVLLLRGTSLTLHAIVDEYVTLRGVGIGKLAIVST